MTEMVMEKGNFNDVADETTSRLNKATDLIVSATKWGAAASLVPVPALELAALGVVQARLIVDLTELYDEKLSSQTANGLVSVILGTLLPTGAAQVTAGYLLKFLPGYGTIIGGLSMAAFGSAATYAVGKVFVRHFENGGTVKTLSADVIKDGVKAEFEAAKK